jgi:hypothetical protein
MKRLPEHAHSSNRGALSIGTPNHIRRKLLMARGAYRCYYDATVNSSGWCVRSSVHGGSDCVGRVEGVSNR